MSFLLKCLGGTPTNSSTELDSEDFLNVYFLPSTLVLESDLLGEDGILLDNGTLNRKADVETALSTMNFHRSMINKYLCRNYLANEILSEVDRSDIKADRLGIAAKTSHPSSRILLKNSPIDQNELLDDEGSDHYKKWLAKSSIFEDIYKHHTASSDEDQEGSASNMQQLYESGDITGYAVQSDTKEKQASQTHIPDHHVHHLDHDHGHYHHGHDEEKGLALKDLFDLALTALAFLAFGTFVLNLILTCFSVQPPAVVMQMNGGGDGGDDSRFTRVKRDSPVINVDYLNQVSYSVVKSLDALATLQQNQSKQQEHCLRLSICESNRFARELSSQQQVWVPVWSFGLSWISGKMRGKSESMLEYLRAIILGMGRAQCERIYSQCKQKM
ncbi:hypothetical protein LSTR_LSTR010507 [Laodelphax striatellus]|uniref:Uncharacterized protein n=1 Tax=Laodelphax striatellus TaxID=195883 RepID=A0A482WS52_LAOST|nr:hypothetical protein LSTR_LSTR010507 [Laodelphax striatellus]